MWRRTASNCFVGLVLASVVKWMGRHCCCLVVAALIKGLVLHAVFCINQGPSWLTMCFHLVSSGFQACIIRSNAVSGCCVRAWKRSLLLLDAPALLLRCSIGGAVLGCWMAVNNQCVWTVTCMCAPCVCTRTDRCVWDVNSTLETAIACSVWCAGCFPATGAQNACCYGRRGSSAAGSRCVCILMACWVVDQQARVWLSFTTLNPLCCARCCTVQHGIHRQQKQQPSLLGPHPGGAQYATSCLLLLSPCACSGFATAALVQQRLL
jgi:hypothetical protein